MKSMDVADQDLSEQEIAMAKADELHEKAMELVSIYIEGEGRNWKKDDTRRVEIARKALQLEKEALELTEITLQPSHSILARSAAWTALDALDFSEASRLVALGLNNVIDPKIRGELEDVQREIKARLDKTMGV